MQVAEIESPSVSSWLPFVSQSTDVLLGFGLSSLSRGYRERRAQLKAEQARVRSQAETEQKAFQRQVLDSLQSLQQGHEKTRERLAALEAVSAARAAPAGS